MNKKNITTALMVAILIGSMLNLINSYEVFVNSNFSTKNTIKILLTYLTPFCVSLYSSAKANKQSELTAIENKV